MTKRSKRCLQTENDLKTPFEPDGEGAAMRSQNFICKFFFIHTYINDLGNGKEGNYTGKGKTDNRK